MWRRILPRDSGWLREMERGGGSTGLWVEIVDEFVCCAEGGAFFH